MTDHLEDFLVRGLLPTPPIQATHDIGVTSTDVWTVISQAGNLTNVHPFCERNDIDVWPGPHGRDHVHYYSGLHYQRDVLAWNDGKGYTLALGPNSGAIAIARWVIQPTRPKRCTLSIEVTSFVRDDVSPETRARYEATVIQGAIPPYLDSVMRGVGHYSETGRPVARNQFGAQDLYSPPTGMRKAEQTPTARVGDP
jgi:hypothetical protein